MDYNLNDLLQEVTNNLAIFLENELPMLFKEEWWNHAVVSNLNPQQQRQLQLRNIKSLEQLDLAALLRVFNQNWYQISNQCKLLPEDRNYVKEMQTIRNRWAHPSSENIDPEDVYRDLDTLQRFSQTIKANQDFIQKIKAAKIATNGPKPTADNKKMEFIQGEMVCLRSNDTIIGAIIASYSEQPENLYKVFIENKVQNLYASQLMAVAQQEDDFKIVSAEQFHARLTALQIRHPSLSTLYSLNSARIDFIPYQFRPVLKFIRSDRPRILIADSVGVGKTIEAGLILRELQARREINSVLIICPRPLVVENKWKNEMKRFGENFEHLNNDNLRYCVSEMDKDGYWPENHRRIILSYSAFDEDFLYGSSRQKKGKRHLGLLNLDPVPRFDLVIVDEAHHIRNDETARYKSVRFFCDNAEAVVFLTATPVQLGSRDLFVLLNALRPDLIIDQEAYKNMAEPNQYISQAVNLARTQKLNWHEETSEALRMASSTEWGRRFFRDNPEFIKIQEQVSGGNISAEGRVQLITDIEAQHTFSGVINRTRRRDIGSFTTRKAETVSVPFTETQKKLHDDILQVQADIFRTLHGNQNVQFMISTIRRQAASSLFGLVPLLKDILNRHIDQLVWEEIDQLHEAPDVDDFGSIKSEIDAIIAKAKKLDGNDPKLAALKKIIREKQTLSNKKIMLFSSFRHTLGYLYDHLKADGVRCGLVHGGTPDEERVSLRSQFEKASDQPDALDLLLFSEVGCEGLDYQFCDCIVNYDLPWNPMRIEQRIGRIDRNGQKSEAIAIYNLITPDTVDAEIYERCLWRIGIFQNTLGGSEEILGDIVEDIREVAENFSLSNTEREVKLQQLADNKIRLIQEQNELEEKQMELIGIRLPQDLMKKEIADASSFWLSPDSLQGLVTHYLKQACGKEQEFILGEKPLKTLRLSHELRLIILKDFQKLPKQSSSTNHEWEKWLKGTDPHLSITFEADCASENPQASLISPVHPLIKQAANYIDDNEKNLTVLQVSDSEIPAGQYQFIVYGWQFKGVRDDLVFHPITSSRLVTKRLVHLLQYAEQAPAGSGIDLKAQNWDELKKQHHSDWNSARDSYQQYTRRLADYRKASLETSQKARLSMLNEQITRVMNEKIRKMRESEKTSAISGFEARIKELEDAVVKADIIAEPVAFGILIVEGK